MNALFNEHEQHASYTRTLSDPGGENQIIMFKSCFPTSDLQGNPNDPPGTYEELSVSGAKYVYNTILQYFATRPDKLFIVITAPPLSDATHAANARAFNEWLLNDWLRENNYVLNNVAVFDFYNILTSPDAHHRFNNGGVEHLTSSSNTLHYPSGDDHPSAAGSQKATEEFLPMLNIFYHRWKSGAPTQPPPADIPTAQIESAPEIPAPASPVSAGLLDDFEADARLWEPFGDDATATTMKCSAQTGAVNSGSRALFVEYNIAPAGWGTCAHFPESTQDWSAGDGLTFYVHATQAGIFFDVDIYAGSRDAQETYLYTVTLPAECAAGYVPITVKWSDFTRASWEENAGAVFDKPNQIVGMAFGIGSSDAANIGSFWVDDLAIAETSAPAAPEQPIQESATEQPAPQEQPAPADEPQSPALPCAGALFPLILGLTLWKKKTL
jgi:hypothetical protein